ncbi:MAG: TIGR04283 family arsenosugar biosynthesis glycosyltransferase [Deltaproteobacteria bacterium]|nr:TIGR04283 family arsenosugar biosynthesis glycosyltransferase [Deltaproteobacteria bacterium]
MLASRFPLPMRIAIIMPTLDEEAAISQHVADARQVADQLIVSDGGSQDKTRDLAHREGAEVVVGPCGRGPQLNLGAKAAEAEVLVFLHADTRLPRSAAELIRHAVRNQAVGGGFLLRFDSDQKRFKFAAKLINWRTRFSRLPLGDQAQFVSRSAFETLGGFQKWPILEDLDFARRLKKQGKTVILEDPVVTSARRYQQGGLIRTTARNWTIWLLFCLGVSPHRLSRLYRRAP